MVQRLTYRRRHCYATKSNKVRKVKTPGAPPGDLHTGIWYCAGAPSHDWQMPSELASICAASAGLQRPHQGLG